MIKLYSAATSRPTSRGSYGNQKERSQRVLRAKHSIPRVLALCGSSTVRSWTGTCSTLLRTYPSLSDNDRTRRWQMPGISDQEMLSIISVVRPAEPQLGAEAALPARVADQGAMQHGRRGIESGSHAAPQLAARASRGRHSPRRRLERNGRLHMPASGGERGAARRVYVERACIEVLFRRYTNRFCSIRRPEEAIFSTGPPTHVSGTVARGGGGSGTLGTSHR